MSVSLSPRLRAVYDRIGTCSTLADVGCDHGKLAVKCLQEGVCDTAIATDVSGASLTKAAALADLVGVELDCRVGDGLAPLASQEADAVVIAGLGGKEIVEILRTATWRPARLLLVPHRDAPWVRKYLHLAGYSVDYDGVLRDADHDYWVLDAHGGKEGDIPLDELEGLDGSLNWYVGKDAPACPDWPAIRDKRIDKLQRELSLGSRNPHARWELEQLKRL